MILSKNNILFTLISALYFLYSGVAYSTACKDTFDKNTYYKFKRLMKKVSNSDGSVEEGYRDILNSLVSSGMETSVLDSLLDKSQITRKELARQLDVDISKIIPMKNVVMRKIIKTLPDILQLRSRVLNNDGTIIQEYMDIKGQARFAKRHFNGLLIQAYDKVFHVLDRETFHRLGWHRWSITTTAFDMLMNTGLLKSGEVNLVTVFSKFNKLINSYDSIGWMISSVLHPISFERMDIIFNDRFKTENPVDRKELVQRFGISRERVRQLEMELANQMVRQLSSRTRF